MDKGKTKKVSRYIILNILFLVLFILLEIVGIFIDFNREEIRLLIRILARGVFGILILYNSAYLLFTRNASFIAPSDSNTKKRILAGILLGIVGLITVITAFLGYGMNGDPVLRWWEL